jgi:hypothetical protein
MESSILLGGRVMSKEDHLLVLRDESKYVVDRIRAAVQLELYYWKDREDPPNLGEEEFRRILNFIPRGADVRWDERKSLKGPHGQTGEDKVFNVNFELIRGRFKFVYYIKGFFFDRDDLKGVCIQSFRIVSKINRTKLRVV